MLKQRRWWPSLMQSMTLHLLRTWDDLSMCSPSQPKMSESLSLFPWGDRFGFLMQQPAQTYSWNPVSYTCCICTFLLVLMFFKLHIGSTPQEGELVHRIHQVRGADCGPVWQPQLAGVAGELEHHQHAAGLLRGRRLRAPLERCEFTVSYTNSWSQLYWKLLFVHNVSCFEHCANRYSAGIVWLLLSINLRQILKRVEAQPPAWFMVSCSTHLMMRSMQNLSVGIWKMPATLL